MRANHNKPGDNALNAADRGRFILVVVAVVLVAVLVQLAPAQDSFSALSRPFIVRFLQVCELNVVDHGDGFHLGRLDIPWSRDCAGVNLLLVMLGLILWQSRRQKLSWRLGLVLLGALPLALLANLLRVLVLIGYRELVYPDVESPQLHYFVGLACLIPFALLILPRTNKSRAAEFLELGHAAAVVALMIPMGAGPGGVGLTLAVLSSLAHCQFPTIVSRARLGWTLVWLFVAAGIALAGIESLWMPWLLLCPLLADVAWCASPWGVILIAASYPLFSLLPYAEYIVWAVLGFAVWKGFKPKPPRSPNAPKLSPPQRFVAVMAMVSLTAPFLASSLVGEGHETMQPPPEAQKTVVPSGYELRLPGQSPELSLLWYEPSGNGRHHTVQVCLRYRGVELKPVADHPDIYTDGTYWIREFYLQEEKLLPDHLSYVKSTLWPRSAPGIHLIILAPCESMTTKAFELEARYLAGDVHTRVLRTKATK